MIIFRFDQHTHTNTRIHTYIYIHIHIYMLDHPPKKTNYLLLPCSKVGCGRGPYIDIYIYITYLFLRLIRFDVFNYAISQKSWCNIVLCYLVLAGWYSFFDICWPNSDFWFAKYMVEYVCHMSIPCLMSQFSFEQVDSLMGEFVGHDIRVIRIRQTQQSYGVLSMMDSLKAGRIINWDRVPVGWFR